MIEIEIEIVGRSEHRKIRKSDNRTIEHQMRDVGALGYRNRTVEVFYISPWFMITTELEEEPSPNPKSWVKSGKYVNELELWVE